MALLVLVPLVPPHFCHCRPRRPHPRQLQVSPPLVSCRQWGIACTGRASCRTPCAASPPTLSLLFLFLCWRPRPSWAPSVSLLPSTTPRPCLLLRARCIATHGAPWVPCYSASGSFLSLPVPLSCPSACSLLLCAHCAEQAMCTAHLVVSLRLPCPLPSLGLLLRSCPLLPFRVFYHYSLCSAPFRARCTSVCSTPCTTLTFSRAGHIVLVTGGRLACCLLSPAGGGVALGAPDWGCGRRILSPAFCLTSHLHVSAPA